MSKPIRRVLLGLMALGLGVVVLLAALPLWLPWLLKPVGAKFGLRYSGYQRVGYQRFALTDAAFTNSSMVFRTGRMEGFIPTVWLWHIWFAGDRAGDYLSVKNWEIKTTPTPGQTEGKGANSTYESIQRVRSVLPELRRWVPAAALTNGEIHSGEFVTRVPQAAWKDGILSGDLDLPKYDRQLTLKLDSRGHERTDIVLDSKSLQLTSEISLRTNTEGLRVESTNSWQGNPILLAAQFDRNNKLPADATLDAKSFRIPLSLFGMRGYEDVTGSLSASWKEGGFAVDLRAGAQPLTNGQPNLPPIDVRLRARGGIDNAIIERAEIKTPWLNAELSDGVQLGFRGPLLRSNAVLKVAVDFARQPWSKASGIANGTIDFSPSTNKYPNAAFTLSGADIKTPVVELASAALRGKLQWPMLQVSALDLRAADGSKVSASGTADVVQRSVSGGRLNLEGSFGRQFFPPGYGYDRASLTASFAGPWPEIEHSGKLHLEHFQGGDLRPANLELDWSARGTNALQSDLAISTDRAALKLGVAFEQGVHNASLDIKSFALLTNGSPALQLEHSCRVAVALSNESVLVTSEPFHWAGKAGDVKLAAEVAWPGRGTIRGTARLPDATIFGEFFTNNWPEAAVQNMEFSGGWTNGPVTGQIVFSGQTITPKAGQVFATAEIDAGEKGILISNMMVTSSGHPVISARGNLPIVLMPARESNRLEVLAGQPIQLHVMAGTNSIFWDQIASLTGVILKQPQLNADISGSWESPQGRIALRASEVKLPGKTAASVDLEDLELNAELTRAVARLTEFHVLVQGQPVTGSAELPLGAEFWRELRAGRKLPDWRRASAQITMRHAEVKSFAYLAPRLLAPQGQFDADLSLLPGAQLQGGLKITGAQTRPLSVIGSLQDIQAQVQFSGRTMDVSANLGIGGEPLTARGTVDLSGNQWLHGELPGFNLTVHGTNVPLARKPGLVVRSTLNISLAKTNGQSPWISGTVGLRDSYFLQDLSSLIPRRVAAPSERPPYFSISDPLLADWRLNLDISGVRFMKVGDPLFKGEVSANLKLQGTLKDPIATGDVRIDSGFVQFPFGSLLVSQGFVTLSRDNPSQPQLEISAASRQFGYQIRMDVTGPVNQPVIQFSSAPPLSSEQILLMLTAGEVPVSGFSLTPQQRAQSLAVFVGKNILSKYGFAGDPDRLTFKSGTDITEQGKPTYDAEYKMTKRWSLVGEYDRFGDFNGGLKWLIYSR